MVSHKNDATPAPLNCTHTPFLCFDSADGSEKKAVTFEDLYGGGDGVLEVQDGRSKVGINLLSHTMNDMRTRICTRAYMHA